MGLRDRAAAALGRMGLIPLGAPRVTAAAAAPPPPLDAAPPRVDTSPFMRANSNLGLNASRLVALSSWVLGDIGPGTLPRDVPWHVIDAMGWDPIIYLGEKAFASPLMDPGLYVVDHQDPRVKAETEEWLRPLLPRLLPMITRAVSYGAAPLVFDWQSRDLVINVVRDGKAPRRNTLVGHQHYGAIHDLHPGAVQLLVEGDRLLEVRHAGQTFRQDRAFCSVWDMQFGDWRGMASRRRAYKPWFDGLHVERWQSRYLERSVDPPRIGYAPKGIIKINGEDVQATKLLAAALMGLKNGAAGVLPGSLDKDTGKRLFEVAPMQLPDVHSVWHDALEQYDAKKMLASMVPPTTAGIADGTFAGGRISNDMYVELLEAAASWVAGELSCIVGVPHVVNRTRANVEPPTVRSRELPKAKVKRLLELYRSAATVERKAGEGKVVTLAELIDVSILDDLGVKRRSVEEAARDKGAPPPMGGEPGGESGRPRELFGDREERRENAREPEGEDATGGDGEQAE